MSKCFLNLCCFTLIFTLLGLKIGLEDKHLDAIVLLLVILNVANNDGKPYNVLDIEVELGVLEHF